MTYSIKLYFRVLWLVLLLAILALAAEGLYVLSMRAVGHSVPFTSFYASLLFSGICGFLPFVPSPSRISPSPLTLFNRFALLVEVSATVVIFAIASRKFAIAGGTSFGGNGTWSIYAYGIVLLCSLLLNYRRIRHEAAAVGHD